MLTFISSFFFLIQFPQKLPQPRDTKCSRGMDVRTKGCTAEPKDEVKETEVSGMNDRKSILKSQNMPIALRLFCVCGGGVTLFTGSFFVVVKPFIILCIPVENEEIPVRPIGS
jgi:hypothetical protein